MTGRYERTYDTLPGNTRALSAGAMYVTKQIGLTAIYDVLPH